MGTYVEDKEDRNTDVKPRVDRRRWGYGMGKTGIPSCLSGSHELVVRSGNWRKQALKKIKMHFCLLFLRKTNVYPGRMCGTSHLTVLSLTTVNS